MEYLFSSKNIYGAFLIVLCGALGMGCSSLIHGMSVEIPAFQMLFLKTFSAFVIISCFYKPKRLCTLLTSQMKKWHFIKAAAGVLGNLFWILALQHLPIADCAALGLSSALFTTLGGLFLFYEKNSYVLWISLLLGICGVLMILKPSFDIFNIYGYFPLASALFFSISSLIVKKVALKDISETTLLYLMGLMSLLSLGPAIYQWVDLAWWDYIKITSIGILYALSHLFLIEAYTHADASFISPFKFTRFPLNVLSGLVFFAEIPSYTTLIGAGIIIGSSTLMFISQKYKDLKYMKVS